MDARKIICMTAALLISLSALLSVKVFPVFAAEPFVAAVQKVIDGDSLQVVSVKDTIEVRLYGIDCPEYRQPYSNVARKMTRKKVSGRKVLVQPEYYDKYQRLVAIVHFGDDTLNEELVRAGLAWVSPYFCRKEICSEWQQLENSAREAKRGLWKEKQPVPPWQWKKMKHNR